MHDLCVDNMLVFLCIQKLLLHEREKRERAETAWREQLEKCGVLFKQLQECNFNLPYEDDDRTFLHSSSSSSLNDAFNQLKTSDDQIDILLAEVRIIFFLWLVMLLPVAESSSNYFVSIELNLTQ
jgi:hypothetical protein